MRPKPTPTTLDPRFSSLHSQPATLSRSFLIIECLLFFALDLLSPVRPIPLAFELLLRNAILSRLSTPNVTLGSRLRLSTLYSESNSWLSTLGSELESRLLTLDSALRSLPLLLLPLLLSSLASPLILSFPPPFSGHHLVFTPPCEQPCAPPAPEGDVYERSPPR